MPTSILPQNQDEKELFNAISSFFSRFKIGNLLRACNAQKEKGVPVTRIFLRKKSSAFMEKFYNLLCWKTSKHFVFKSDVSVL